MARPFSVRLEGREIHLSGDLDLSTAPIFEGHLDGVTEGSGDVVVDAADLTFVDSSGIRALFGLARRLEGRGRLVVRNPTEQVLRVFDLVHAEALLEIRFDGADD